MWLWVNWTLIKGQGICLLHVYIPVMHEMGWGKCTSWVQPCVFFTYRASTRRYRACVIRRLLPSGPQVMKMSLPGLIIESVQPAVGYIAFICLVQFIFNSDDSPDIFLIFYEPFASRAYSLLFYCHSYVWMVWSAASVGSLTVQIKRFSSFATLLVVCVCLCLLCHSLDAHLSSWEKKQLLFYCPHLSGCTHPFMLRWYRRNYSQLRFTSGLHGLSFIIQANTS